MVGVPGGLYATEQGVQEVKTNLEAIQALQQEIKDLNENLLYLLTAMFEKMPRVTGNDQAAVSIEAGTVAISGTVTTNTTITAMNYAGTKYINGDNLNMSGLQQLYSNIVVS